MTTLLNQVVKIKCNLSKWQEKKNKSK
ncbi:rCG63657 [Rattus norvegicus]|uniref:RCG63657 n=1 Tax=Rattus norvegicus TaxID=10116 RepID=A6KHC5_RAT|nr:rCG63657 [Rattus norvegicus]